jgi:predicted phosphodiesterase
MASRPSLTLALITDTHVRPPFDDGQRAFPSDQDHNARNAEAATVVRTFGADAIVHLGDVVHPIPTLPSHQAALDVAAQTWGTLGVPLLVVAGNHDVGDKRTSINAPILAAEARVAFERQWGKTWRRVDLHGVRLLVVDGGLLGLDSPEALAQAAWLEATLAEPDHRTFVFTHYPPFLCDPDEAEHYDNLPPETRLWLLDRLADAGVEAVFSGHVHRFFYNRYRGIDLYTLPSVAFVRPEYSGLRPVPPMDIENGRDDRPHLDADGHRLEVMRLHTDAAGRWSAPRPLGTWLRTRLGRRAEIPYGDLDALTRKEARDDAALLAVRDLGLSRVRLPLADLADPAVRDRLAWLARAGVGVSVFSGGLPTPSQAAQAEGMEAWEVVVRPSDVPALAARLAEWSGPGLTLGRIGRPWTGDGEAPTYFSHFPRQGFDAGDPAVDTLVQAAAAGAVARVAFRIAAEGPVEAQVAAAVGHAARLGVGATLHVELPFETEAVRQTDDARVTERVLAADRAAWAHPDAHVFLDLLYDKDRGYYCRNALVDGADRPRAAYAALKRAGKG